MLFNLLVEELAEDAARDRSHNHVPKKPPILRNLCRRCSWRVFPAKPANDQPQPILEEVENYREQRARVEGNVECFTRVFPMQEPGKKDQMSCAADGEKLCEGLHESENNRLKQGHRVQVSFLACRSFAGASKSLRIS